MKKTALLTYALLVMITALDAPAQKGQPAKKAPQEATFKMVINTANPTTVMSIKDISKIFYKRTVRWDLWRSGDEKKMVIPIDQGKDAEVRKSFSKYIHGKSATALEFYWQRQIFSGRGINPDKLSSDNEVLEFVRANAGAIGYVSQDAELGEGVKELKISE